MLLHATLITVAIAMAALRRLEWDRASLMRTRIRGARLRCG